MNEIARRASAGAGKKEQNAKSKTAAFESTDFESPRT
jgi:hypothetical protein